MGTNFVLYYRLLLPFLLYNSNMFSQQILFFFKVQVSNLQFCYMWPDEMGYVMFGADIGLLLLVLSHQVCTVTCINT